MVSLRDRALIEAKAKGIDTAALGRGQWRQMLRLDVAGSAFAISVFLLIYYAAVGSFTVYFATAFGYPLQRTAALLNWYWAADAIALIVVGAISDRLLVRKPFMVIGALGSLVFLAVFAVDATHPATGYYTFAVLCLGLGVCGAVAFGPWMASFTETVEKHNPAATATGLAVYGWLNRVIVAIAVAVLPVVVSSVTALVEHGKAVAAAAKTLADPAASGQLKEGAAAVLKQYGATVQHASAANPGNWQTWFWVCFAGQVVFVPFIFAMAGRWSPRKAREDLRAHEAAVAEQLSMLTDGSGGDAAAE